MPLLDAMSESKSIDRYRLIEKNKEMIEETASDNPVQLETGEMPVYPAQTIFTDDEPEDETLLFKIIKFTFVGCCISIVVIGAAGITLGLWPLLDKTPLIILTEAPDYLSDNKTPELQVNLKVGIILLVSIGSILIIMGIGGCVGVFKRISWMLCLYINMMFIVLAVQIVTVIVMARNKKQIEDRLEQNLIINLRERYDGRRPSTSIYSDGIDWAQVTFQCCGMENYTEFQTAKRWKHSPGEIVPGTCCIIRNKESFFNGHKAEPTFPACVTKPDNLNSYIEKPCFGEIKKWLLDNVSILTITGSCIIATQILGLIFSCLVMHLE